ncbi:MAG: multidrug efflux system outer membrane protein [Rickettsiales bacterium]|jgi:multidrug efflux system outer membrane protein
MNRNKLLTQNEAQTTFWESYNFTLSVKVLLISFIIAVSGCKSAKNFDKTLSLKEVEESKMDDLENKRFKIAKPILNWWESLEDKQLDALISKSLTNNKDVSIAIANLFKARQVTSESRFDRFPAVTANGSYRRTHFSQEVGFVNAANANNADIGFDASWEIDLFGRVSERIKANVALENSAQSNLRNMYVVISSEVSRGYIELRGAQYRLDIAKRNVENQTETFKLTEKLTNGGIGTRIDILRAKTQLETTKSTIPALKAEISANINRLSVLTGQVPNALKSELTSSKPLPTIPSQVNIGNVADLLKRRPDILIAKNDLKAAIANYNVSIKDQFPTVNIVGAIGFAATTFSNIGATALNAFAGPSVSWSAFDLGRIQAQIHQKDAEAQIAVAFYEKTVLESLEDLQTSISNFSREEETRERLKKAAIFSKEAALLAKIRYEAGVDTFIDVLESEGTLLATEDALAVSEINSALNLISIYKALGGGWEVKKK